MKINVDLNGVVNVGSKDIMKQKDGNASGVGCQADEFNESSSQSSELIDRQTVLESSIKKRAIDLVNKG